MPVCVVGSNLKSGLSLFFSLQPIISANIKREISARKKIFGREIILFFIKSYENYCLPKNNFQNTDKRRHYFFKKLQLIFNWFLSHILNWYVRLFDVLKR